MFGTPYVHKNYFSISCKVLTLQLLVPQLLKLRSLNFENYFVDKPIGVSIFLK